MPATAAILEELAKAPPKGVVVAVGSLKSPLRNGLAALRAAGGTVTSVHPMFGPDTELLSGRHVIFIDLGAPAANAAARALFEPTMATLVEMDLESHDRLIAYAKWSQDGANHVIVVVNLDPFAAHEARVRVPPEAVGVAAGASYWVRDLLTGARYLWEERNYVRLDPVATEPAHILLVENR